MAKNQGKDPTSGELEFARSLINGEEPLFCKWVTKRKISAGKVQDRLIVVGKYRVFSCKKTITGKKQVQREGHYFDLTGINSADVDKVVLKFRDFEIDIQEDAAGTELLMTIRKAIQLFTFHFAEYALPAITLYPPDRLVVDLPAIDPGPADGLIATYLAYCDYYTLPPSNEFTLYVKDLVAAGNRDLSIDRCPGIERKENAIHFTPIHAALRHNTYFTSFTFRNIPRRDISEGLHDTLLHNVTISKIQLQNVAVSDNAIFNLGGSLKRNKHHALVDLDISGNKNVGEKGFGALAEALQSMPHTMFRINMAACGMNQKSTSAVLQALSTGKEVSKGLQELDMSYNTFGPVGSSQLANWFVQPEAAQYLKFLLLCDTKLDITPVMKAIKNGGLINLVELDLSQNKVDLNAAVTIGAVVESNPKLSLLNISYCGLQSQPLEAIFGAIARCENQRITVKISGNELGILGAQTVATSIRASRNIHYLVARGCGFKKEGLMKIVEQLAENTTLRAIDLGFNFRTGSSGKMTKLMEKLAQAVVAHPTLEYLALAGDGNRSSIGKEIMPVIDCIQRNPNLAELDISGNKLGDQLAISLCDSLRANTKLKLLSWDRNGISIGGWLALANALSHNRSLQDVPQPAMDIEKALREAKNRDQLFTRIKEAMEKIKNQLKENNGGQPYQSEYLKLNKGRTYDITDMPLEVYSDSGSSYNTNNNNGNTQPYPNNAGYSQPPPYGTPPPVLSMHEIQNNLMQTSWDSPPPPAPAPYTPTNYASFAQANNNNNTGYSRSNTATSNHNAPTHYGSVTEDYSYNSEPTPPPVPYDYDQQDSYYDPPPPPPPGNQYDPPAYQDDQYYEQEENNQY